MTIRVWGYLAEYEAEREDILDAVDTVFRSGQLVYGPHMRGFEEAFAAYHNIAHAVGVDNGTNAIVLGLRALGVGEGDEVITVSNTAAPTVLAIDQIGAKAVFVDIHEDSYLMNVSQVEAAITERTKAIVPVHLYGQCVEMAPLKALAAKHNLRLFEDCAQSHGARHHGELAGTMSEAAAFSFYPTKVLGAYGDAGATVTASDEIAARLKRLRYYGMAERYYVVETPGHNARLDEVHGEILRRKLTRLDKYIADRQAIAARYNEALADLDFVTPSVVSGNEHSYYLYVLRHPQRDAIIEGMLKYDIQLNVSYRWPCHTQSGFAKLGYKTGDLPVTERLADEIFSLPMYPSLGEDQDKVIHALREVRRTL